MLWTNQGLPPCLSGADSAEQDEDQHGDHYMLIDVGRLTCS